MRLKMMGIPILAVLFALALSACENANSSDTQKTAPEAAASGIPRLVDLGADKCVPCKMMAPILDELEEEYAGRMEVVFIDVWKNRELASEYGVQMIPTQIFYDESGKELFRRSGFIGKEEILAKWRELGYDFEN